jgi:CcmD family protein
MCRFFLRVFFFMFGMMMTGWVLAQDSLKNEKPQMAEGMRANGKIYVVVAVLLIILTGIFIYLIRLDRKMSRLEKDGK